MTTPVSIDIDTQLYAQLMRKAKDMNTNPQALILQAIQHLLYWDKVEQLQATLEAKALKQGFQSEEDIFNAIS